MVVNSITEIINIKIVYWCLGFLSGAAPLAISSIISYTILLIVVGVIVVGSLLKTICFIADYGQTLNTSDLDYSYINYKFTFSKILEVFKFILRHHVKTKIIWDINKKYRQLSKELSTMNIYVHFFNMKSITGEFWLFFNDKNDYNNNRRLNETS